MMFILGFCIGIIGLLAFQIVGLAYLSSKWIDLNEQHH